MSHNTDNGDGKKIPPQWNQFVFPNNTFYGMPLPTPQNNVNIHVNQNGLLSSSLNNVNQMSSQNFQNTAVATQNNLVDDSLVQSRATYEVPPMAQFNQQHRLPRMFKRVKTEERVTMTEYPSYPNGVAHNQHYPSNLHHNFNHRQHLIQHNGSTQVTLCNSSNQQLIQCNIPIQIDELGQNSQNYNIPVLQVELGQNSQNCNIPIKVELGQSSQNLMLQNVASSANDKIKETVRWTEDEHRLFLVGLYMYGKGSWKDIASFVKSKNNMQVASHAQKYFLHQEQKEKEKGKPEKKNKRKSIHDITLEEVDLQKLLPPEFKMRQLQEEAGHMQHSNPENNMPH